MSVGYDHFTNSRMVRFLCFCSFLVFFLDQHCVRSCIAWQGMACTGRIHSGNHECMVELWAWELGSLRE